MSAGPGRGSVNKGRRGKTRRTDHWDPVDSNKDSGCHCMKNGKQWKVEKRGTARSKF